MSSLRATNLHTGEVSELGHDDVSEHLADWIRHEYRGRPIPAPKPQPVARPITDAEWAETERLRDIRFYRYQDEVNGTEPIETDDECEDSEEEQ